MPAAPEREQAMKLTYAVVIEQTPNNYGAYVPDVPGCVSAGDTWDEMQAMIREAIARHNEPIPEDVLRSYAEYGATLPRCRRGSSLWRWRFRPRRSGAAGPGRGGRLATSPCIRYTAMETRATRLLQPRAGVLNPRSTRAHTCTLVHPRAPSCAQVTAGDRP